MASIHKALKQAFEFFSRLLSGLMIQSDANSLPLQGMFIQRKQSFCAIWGRPGSSDCLPIYRSVSAIEEQRFLTKKSQKVGKMTLNLTFQAATVMYLSPQIQNYHHLPVSLDLLGIALVIGFAASFAQIFIQNAFPRFSSLIEKLGSLSAAISFYIMASFQFQGNFAWINRLACVFSLLAVAISFFK